MSRNHRFFGVPCIYKRISHVSEAIGLHTWVILLFSIPNEQVFLTDHTHQCVSLMYRTWHIRRWQCAFVIQSEKFVCALCIDRHKKAFIIEEAFLILLLECPTRKPFELTVDIFCLIVIFSLWNLHHTHGQRELIFLCTLLTYRITYRPSTWIALWETLLFWIITGGQINIIRRICKIKSFTIRSISLEINKYL